MLLKQGRFQYIWVLFIRTFYFKEVALGFKRNLVEKISRPKVLRNISTNISISGEKEYFEDNINNGLIYLFQKCYVAKTKDAIPCARLWAIDSSQNEKLKNIWGETFPTLKQNEVLLENVFTVPKFRGMGIIPAFIYDTCELIKKDGAKYAITFALASNNNTSRAFYYAGFHPYILREVKWLFFRKKVTFTEIPPEVMDHFNKITLRMPRR